MSVEFIMVVFAGIRWICVKCGLLQSQEVAMLDFSTYYLGPLQWWRLGYGATLASTASVFNQNEKIKCTFYSMQL